VPKRRKNLFTVQVLPETKAKPGPFALDLQIQNCTQSNASAQNFAGFA
jgi:hypothetical protein